MKNQKALLLTALILALISAPASGKTTRYAAQGRNAEPYSHDYVKLDGVQFLRNASDDGDSFHVRAKGREHIFRLYFVDTPETDNSFPERVAEQAAYFGITPADAIRVGKLAEAFTIKQLAGHPFTVFTRWMDAKGRSRLERFYAHIFTGDKNLAELLVSNGLARLHGVHANLPDGTHAAVFEKRLLAMEQKAKSEKLGAWGLRGRK